MFEDSIQFNDRIRRRCKSPENLRDKINEKCQKQKWKMLVYYLGEVTSPPIIMIFLLQKDGHYTLYTHLEIYKVLFILSIFSLISTEKKAKRIKRNHGHRHWEEEWSQKKVSEEESVGKSLNLKERKYELAMERTPLTMKTEHYRTTVYRSSFFNSSPSDVYDTQCL